MSNGNKWDGIVQCPFYKRVRREHREIVCESITAEAVVSATRFSTETDLFDYLTRVCCDLQACRRCPVYEAAEAKYAK